MDVQTQQPVSLLILRKIYLLPIKVPSNLKFILIFNQKCKLIMGTHAVNPRNPVKLGKEGCHKFKARLSYTANSRPIRVQRPCPKRIWGEGGGGEGDTIQTRTRLIAQLTLEMCLHLTCPPHPPTFLVQMLTNSKKLEKGVNEEKPRTWLSSS